MAVNKLNREVGEIHIKVDELIKQTDKGFKDITLRLDKINGSICEHKEWIIRTSEWKKGVDNKLNRPFGAGAVSKIVDLIIGRAR